MKTVSKQLIVALVETWNPASEEESPSSIE
jgi:hypothetical protein